MKETEKMTKAVLTVKLKQHTPLLHFQHGQKGATLRASEVKPKLDRYILTKLGEGDYDEGIDEAKKNNWLIGKGEHPALNYKMGIEVEKPRNVSMNVNQRDGLYTTGNYPDNMNSLIMGNMGGRPKDKVLNFVLYDEVNVIFIFIGKEKEQITSLRSKIEQECVPFFAETNFGNRTSKGFGSFTVLGKEKKNAGDWNLSFTINSDNDQLNTKRVYKDLFVIINQIWKYLKKKSTVESGIKSVFLGVESDLKGNEDRIPSPIIFKPIITFQEEDEWDIDILLYLDYSVVENAGANSDDFFELIDNLWVEQKIKLKIERCNLNYGIDNIKIW